MDATQSPEPPPVLTAIPVAVFDRHNRCLSCGYDLFGQPRNGLCPECGTSTRESAARDAFLGDPANVACLRSGARLMLISSIFCGFCPGVCLLLTSADHNGFIAVLMTVIFAATALTAALGDQRLRAMVEADRRASDFGAAPERFTRAPDVIAAVGLCCINAGGYLSVGNGDDKVILWIVAAGFFLLCLTAWRAVPAGRTHAAVAQACFGRGGGLRALGVVKAFYETIWLAACCLGVGLLGISEDSAVFFLFIALFGLFGFVVIWLAMIIVHAIFAARVARLLGDGPRGFEVATTNHRIAVTRP